MLINNNLKVGKWLILYVSVLHLLWGLILTFSEHSFHVNPMRLFREYGVGRLEVGLLFIVGAVLALVGCYRKRRSMNNLIFLIPQQVLLLMSSFSGIISSLMGQYADGVARPGWFIFEDQLPIILLIIFYTAAVFERFSLIGSNHDNR